MTEVVRLLADRHESFPEAGVEQREIRIPQGVREVIGQRLNRLSEQCNQTLVTASIVSREFDLPLMSRLMNGWSDEQLLAALDEALEAHLIEEVSGLSERYQFSHSLVQDTLASELSAARQARLHARIGEALEELYGANAEVHAVNPIQYLGIVESSPSAERAYPRWEEDDADHIPYAVNPIQYLGILESSPSSESVFPRWEEDDADHIPYGINPLQYLGINE